MATKSSGTSKFPQTLVDYLKEAKPVFRNEFDVIALTFHFVMKKMGFRCYGCGESNDVSQDLLLLPTGWNSSVDSYSFRYRHPQSSMTFLIKGITLGEKLLVHGLALEDNHTRSVEIEAKKYVNFDSVSNFENLFKDSTGLINLFKSNITNYLFPTSDDVFTNEQQNSQQSSQRRRNDDDFDNDPLRVPGSGRNLPPRSPLQEGYYPSPLSPPFALGGHDLYPTGPGIGPTPFLPNPDFGGGNLLGPQHPGWGPINPYDPGYGQPPIPGRARGRGRGYPPLHPPGARFDPFGPPSFNYGDPDPDDLPPPNGPYNNMFL